MTRVPVFLPLTTTMNPVGSRLIDDTDLDAEAEARALLIANGLLSDRPAPVPATPPALGAALEVEIGNGELLLCEEEWQDLRDEADPFAEVLDDEHRRRQLFRLRVQLDRLRAVAPADYRVMAMYWGLDGECVSTVAAIAHKLHEDQAVIESRVRDVMTGLQDALGVKRSGPTQLRIADTPQVPDPMVLPARRPPRMLAA